jgi:protein-S-isoprenylcysteine O-methyltransferase Ste14
VYLLFKNLVFLALAFGVFLFWLPLRVFERHARWPSESLEPHHYAALLTAFPALLAYLHCTWLFYSRGRGTPLLIDPPTKLVQRGLYRWVRNPMYLAVLTLVAAEGLFFRSGHILVYWACLLCLLHLTAVVHEERDLGFRFGAMYEDYKRAVPRWIPRRPRNLPAEFPSSSRDR